jgi:hypothetical protein
MKGEGLKTEDRGWRIEDGETTGPDFYAAVCITKSIRARGSFSALMGSQQRNVVILAPRDEG